MEFQPTRWADPFASRYSSIYSQRVNTAMGVLSDKPHSKLAGVWAAGPSNNGDVRREVICSQTGTMSRDLQRTSPPPPGSPVSSLVKSSFPLGSPRMQTRGRGDGEPCFVCKCPVKSIYCVPPQPHLCKFLSSISFV